MPLIWVVAMMIISYAIEEIMARTQKPPVANMQDFSLPQSIEGTPQPVIFGDVWTSDWCVLWWGNLSHSAIYASGK